MASSRYDQLTAQHNFRNMGGAMGAAMSSPEAEQQYQDELAARAMVKDPRFQNITNLDGSLLDQYQLGASEKLKAFDPVKMDPRALNEIRERALNKGPSQWENLMMQRQGIDQQNQMDKAVRGASTQSAQGINQMMQRGGASGGAMERLAAGASKDAMFGRNAVGRQGMSDRLGIGLAGQQEKSDLLKSLPGFESNVANLQMKNNEFLDSQNQFNIKNANDTNQFNLTNKLKGAEMMNTQNQLKYTEQQKARAAMLQGDATERSKK